MQNQKPTKEELIEIIDEMTVEELKELIEEAEKRLLSQRKTNE